MFPDTRDTLILFLLIESDIFDYVSWKYSRMNIFQFSFVPLTSSSKVHEWNGARWRSIVIRIANRRLTECVFRRLSPPPPLRNRPCFCRKFMGRKQGRPPVRASQNFNGTSDSSFRRSCCSRIGSSWTVGARGGPWMRKQPVMSVGARLPRLDRS